MFKAREEEGSKMIVYFLVVYKWKSDLFGMMHSDWTASPNFLFFKETQLILQKRENLCMKLFISSIETSVNV